jgi:hypothetical protein
MAEHFAAKVELGSEPGVDRGSLAPAEFLARAVRVNVQIDRDHLATRSARSASASTARCSRSQLAASKASISSRGSKHRSYYGGCGQEYFAPEVLIG